MKTNILFVGALLFAVLVGCADDHDANPTGAEESDLVVAKAVSDGDIDGESIAFDEAAADSLDRSRSNGAVVLAASKVELSTGLHTCTEYKKNARKITLSFQNNEGDLTPGSVYPIGTSDTASAFSDATYSRSGADCSNEGDAIGATSGFVKIIKATPRAIRGEFELRFGMHGVVKGTFAAPTCLKTRDYGDETPACRK